MTSYIGQTLHGYEIREKIAEGGYGAVYKAYQAAVDREVAVKVILAQHANKPEFAQRFETEARLVARLEHPHIVPLYDFWQDEHGAFLAMRWLPTSLRMILQKQGALSLAQTARILDQVCDALSAAHNAGVIHRDLKPDNILLDERGNAYLTDFGIAKQLEDTRHITDPDAMVGTLAYSAPEQIRNDAVSAPTDIYALGIMLYEMLSAQHPFHDTAPGVLLMNHLQQPLPALTAVRPDVPSALDAVLAKATAKDPVERYLDVQDVASAFREAARLTPAAPVVVPTISAARPGGLRPLAALHPTSPEARNRHNMLQNVRKFWIGGVLENSLHGAALLDLSMEHSSGAVDHAWDTLLREPGTTDKTLPRGTEVLDLFDKLNGKLLILGEPGGGKTTTLLELARDLLFRAEADQEHPIPVIFNLSSWSETHKPLTEWLVDELRGKYQVPRKIAASWVENDALLLLLDGLDEVAANQREGCVQAINAYRAEHGFVDVVVCSRVHDYDALTNRLKLNGAIVIKPLDDEHVDRYLASLGMGLTGVRRMLAGDSTLRELARSPLMLSIIALAFRGVSDADLPRLDTPEAQRKHIFEVYVQRMFERRVGEKPYSQAQLTHYLSWLARKMEEHAQSVFQIEKMQPSWLNKPQWLNYYSRYLMIALLVGAGSIGLSSALLAAGVGLHVELFTLLSVLAACVQTWVIASDRHRFIGWRLLGSLVPGLAWGVGIAATYGPGAGAVVGAMFSAIQLINLYATGRNFAQLGSDRDHIVTVEKLRFSRARINPRVGIAGLLQGSFAVFLSTLILHARPEPFYLLLGMLGAGVILGMQSLYQSGLTTSSVEMRVRPNQGIRDSFTTSLSRGLITGIILGLALWFGLTLSMSFSAALVGLAIGITRSAFAWNVFGGKTVSQHIALRWALSQDGVIAANYAHFLDYAVALVFLRKVGGGYIFVHRYLLEYFAGLENAS
ncbi:MAG: protein kinase [Anaerolineae bacterium]